MKKILSTLLVAAMLLSLVIVAAMPTAAVEGGDWTTWGEAIQYGDNISDEAKTDVAGYDYEGIFDGFHSVGANWAHQSPFTHMQSAQAYDLKQGIYFEVVVEEFEFDKEIDKWYNINIWNQAKFAPPSPNPEYGFGLQTLIRPGSEVGTCKSIQWMKEQWTACGTSAIETPVVETAGEVNYDKFVVEITYDPQAGYHITINGSSLKAAEEGKPNVADAYLNEAFGHDDPTVSSMAYIGFAMHHTKAAGKQSATITKFGTSAADASTPTGNYSKDPDNYSDLIEVVGPMDPTEVPAGQPGILMTGNLKDSDLWTVPTTATGSLISITNDFTVAITGKDGTTDAGTWKVKMSKNYSIADFPTYMVITKDLCTCGGNDKTECEAWEEAQIYYMVGDIIGAASAHTADVWVCDEVAVIDGHVYHYFTVNLVDEYGDVVIGKDDDGNDITMADGDRINGVRLDIFDLDGTNPENLNFEVCMMGFFASDDDAENYALDYFASLEGEEPPVKTEEPVIDTTEAPVIDTTEAPVVDTTEAPVIDTTEAPVVDTTEAPVVDTTEAPVVDTTEAPVVDTTEAPVVDVTEAPVVDTTEAPVVDTTEAPVVNTTEATTEETTEEKTEATTEEKTVAKTEEKTEAKTEEKPDDKKGGCGSVVGFGAVAVVVAVAAGFVSYKKKED